MDDFYPHSDWYRVHWTNNQIFGASDSSLEMIQDGPMLDWTIDSLETAMRDLDLSYDTK